MLPLGTLLKNRYQILKHIASGGFGNTYLAKSLDNNSTVAVKEFFMKGINEYDSQYNVIVSNNQNNELFVSQKQKFLREAQTMACLNNSHIVKVYDSFLSNNTAYYVMEFIEGSTALQMINSSQTPLPENLALNIFVQMLDALIAIHSKNIVHLDIKPSNIIINSNNEAKIIDFGASKIQFSSNETIATFTPSYAPIELQQQQLSNLGPWTDLYSLGATLYFLLTAKKPPLTSDILNYGESAFALPNSISDKTKTLVKWLMQPAKDKRPQNVVQVFKYMETGTLPYTDNDNTVVPNITGTSVNATIYPNTHNNAQYPNFPNNTRPMPQSQPIPPEKKGNGGCVWVVLLIIITIGLIAFFLYKNGFFDKGQHNEQPVVVNTDSIEKEQEKIKMAKERQSELYQTLKDLCDQTFNDIDESETEEELNSAIEKYNRSFDRYQSNYNDVELPEELSDILESKMNDLETRYNEKAKELKEKREQEELERIESELEEMGLYDDDEHETELKDSDFVEIPVVPIEEYE